MAIVVLPEPTAEPEKDFMVTKADADLIKEIAVKIGPIQAMKVTRWLADCRLMTAKKFVEDLLEENSQ